MSKSFKTHNQMLKILRDKNINISNGAKVKRILERENYYCIINGYKDLFLDESTTVKKYKNGTEFDEIFQLFSLDRELKNLFFIEIIKFESFIKSLLGYHFHKQFKDKNSFLSVENFDNNNDNVKDVLKIISTLFNKISQQKNNAVSHYIEKYQHCPLWVLVNYLTFGEISKIYKVCNINVRNDIAKEISKHYKYQYKEKIVISPEMLDYSLGALVMYRNVCAHDERLYNYKGKFKDGALNRAMNTNLLKNKNLFSILVLLKLYINKDDYKKFLRNYKNVFEKYISAFNTISIDDIKNVCGYDEDWINNNI